jgi:hypothetical protein
MKFPVIFTGALRKIYSRPVSLVFKVDRRASSTEKSITSKQRSNRGDASISGSRVKLSNSQIEAYKTELYSLIRSKRDFEQVDQFTRYLTDHCEPSLHLYNVLLKGQLMLRNVEGIKSVLVQIAKNNFAFNAVTLNLLLVYYRDLDMMDEAEKLFTAMCNRQSDPNPLINCAGPNLSAFTTMIAGWASRGDFSKAKMYFEGIGEAQLIADERAKCAYLGAAVGPCGDLGEARRVYESFEGQKSFVALKLWCRASFRLGGLQEALQAALLANSSEASSLELGELLKWALVDLKDNASALLDVSTVLLETCLKSSVGCRLGDPKTLHLLLDAVKGDCKSFERLAELCLQFPATLLPVLGGRLLAESLHHVNFDGGGRLLLECEKLRVALPPGLVQDCSKLKFKRNK